jgi:hypothetical protein
MNLIVKCKEAVITTKHYTTIVIEAKDIENINEIAATIAAMEYFGLVEAE